MILGKTGSVFLIKQLLEEELGKRNEVSLEVISNLVTVLDCLKALGYKDSIVGIYKNYNINIALTPDAYNKLHIPQNNFDRTIASVLRYHKGNSISFLNSHLTHPSIKDEYYLDCSEDILNIPLIEEASTYLVNYSLSNEQFIHPILQDMIDASRNKTVADLSKSKFIKFIQKFHKDVEFQIIPNIADEQYNKEEIVVINSCRSNSICIDKQNTNEPSNKYNTGIEIRLKDIDSIRFNKVNNDFIITINYNLNNNLYSFTAKILTNIVNILDHIK